MQWMSSVDGLCFTSQWPFAIHFRSCSTLRCVLAFRMLQWLTFALTLQFSFNCCKLSQKISHLPAVVCINCVFSATRMVSVITIFAGLYIFQD